MTRKEQIKEYLLTIGGGDMKGIPFDVGFECGAEWADAHPNWISVEDEFPPKDDDFIIDLSIYVLATDGKTINLCYYDYNKECWFDGDLWKLYNITHWMPLPVPPSCSVKPNNYKEGGKE